MRILITLAFAALPVLACSCQYLTVCELIKLPTIFVGEVIDGGVSSIRDDPWYSNVDHVRFKVLENFRGLPSGTQTLDVQLHLLPGMCAPIPYYPGRKYLVMPYTRDGKFYDGMCFQGRDVETAADDVRQVREYFAGKMPINVHGQIAVARDSDSIDYLVDRGEAKPLAGVRISTSHGGNVYSTVSSSDGRYTLPLPTAGFYQVRAVLKPYVSEHAEITVPSGGCMIRDFGLTVDNTISGRVWDAKGQLVKDAKVGLIDLDGAPSDTDRRAWLSEAYTEQPDKTFKLKNVPIGRYLLIFNPNGPRSGELFDLPLESTYFPSDSTRANARAVEVKSDGVHMTEMDLVAGKHIEFRHVVVRVRFPDGAPMTTAEIRCAGLPLKGNDHPWFLKKVGLKGSVEFSAPADRKLRLEVRDWYKRDLKRTYTSSHEPGRTTITQEFVVSP